MTTGSQDESCGEAYKSPQLPSDAAKTADSLGKCAGAVVAAVVLMAAAWCLAQWPPVRRASDAADLGSVSMGWNLLIAGGLPWLLQWAALALLLATVARKWFAADRTAVLIGVLFPLTVGSCWWFGLAAYLWTSDPLQAIADTLGWLQSRAYGSESFGEMLLFEILGPLTCPLSLKGPWSLRGWAFLQTALSTVLAMSLWTWATVWCSSKSGPRQWSTIALVALIYSSPVFLRAILRILQAV